ncbi:MAG: flagellar hook-associated protein FlgK, partial [Anaerovibrio sp.]|nr:flagellar hook-associated protein FlgK [Anaerovibrio sp.]
NTMVRCVFANKLSLDTVCHNITNASTEGYSRQSVNQAATRAQEVPSLYGNVLVGSGVDAMSLQRARNIYADKQYWAETSTHEYYKAAQVNYDKLEAIFDDSDKTGIKNAMDEFYKAWSSLSKDASADSTRVTVIEKGNIFVDKVSTAASQLQEQINAQYDDIRVHLTTINDINDQIVELNKNIMGAEAVGASANDLRDQRDLLVDKLSTYMNLNVYEDDKGMYTIVSNGISMVNGINKLTLEMSEPYTNADYGLNDYTIQIKESGIAFIPQNGALKAELDTIAEDKGYIDNLANMAAFMMTTFNTMHQQGAGIDGTDGNIGPYDNNAAYTGPTYGINFFGDNNTVYAWDNTNNCVVATEYTENSINRSLSSPTTATDRPVVTIDGTINSTTNLKGMNIINVLQINSKLTAVGGTSLVAARSLAVEAGTNSTGAYDGTYKIVPNGTKDGTNAVNLSTLFNLASDNISTTADVVYGTTTVDMSNRSINDISLNAYYQSVMSQLGTDAASMDNKE